MISVQLNMDTMILSDHGRIDSHSEDLSERFKSEENEVEAKDDLPTTGLLHTNTASPESPGRRNSVIVHHAKWYFGWKIITTMIACYLLAFGCALTHYFFFRWLNGQPAGNEASTLTQICLYTGKYCRGQRTDQVYVSVVSVMITVAFATCIKISLSIAFTQCLWEKLRTRSMKVGTIESLFLMRGNVLHFLNVSIWKRATILVLVAVGIYFIPIATSFAPGALTIKSESSVATVSANIWTFNSSATNGTLRGAMLGSFGTFNYYNTSDTNLLLYAYFWTPAAPLARLATRTSIDGQWLPFPSPCGPNCTYTYEFEGPTFNCSSTTVNGTWDHVGLVNITADIYAGSWSYFEFEDVEMWIKINETEGGRNYHDYQKPFLNISVVNFQPDKYQLADLKLYNNASVSYTETSLTCLPYRSLYTVTNSYANNIQTLNYSFTQLEQLPRVDMFDFGTNLTINSTGLTNDDYINGVVNATWTEENMLWYRNTQMMGIVTGATAVLNGTCNCLAQAVPYWLPENDLYSDWPIHWWGSQITPSGNGGPIMPYTQLSSASADWTWDDIYDTNSAVSFDVTEEGINKLVGDYVVSIAPAFKAWNQTVNAVESPSLTVYSSSRQEHLIIPYAAWLAVALPIILWGLFCLRRNGVPANDGGFIQILTTTTGSQALRLAAAGNCLGGDGHLPKNLKDLEIKFGEVMDSGAEINGVRVRRAGFGTEDEVGPLVRGERYGVIQSM